MEGLFMKDNESSIVILLAEDDPDDRLMTQEALEESSMPHKFFYVEDGIELLDYLYNRGRFSNTQEYPRPGIILLDLNMPRKDGREALLEIKKDPKLKSIPVVILTTSKAEEDIIKTYDYGANSFITKPVTFDGLVNVVKLLETYWFNLVSLPKS
jgi:CheY-like chemotaxis protein